MSSGVWLQREAERLGFRRASRAGVDEARFAFSTSTHIAFVTAPHELHRGVEDASLLATFRADLLAAVGFCEAATDERVLVAERIEMRPLVSFDAPAPQRMDSWPSSTTPHEAAIIEHDADLRSWPVLGEDPDGGG